jgi:hypothetical protein
MKRKYILTGTALLAIYLTVRGGGKKEVDRTDDCESIYDVLETTSGLSILSSVNEFKLWNYIKVSERCILLQKCQRMWAVAILQRWLQIKGHPIEITGIFGNATENALEKQINSKTVKLIDIIPYNNNGDIMPNSFC